ncbi:MAG: hypothetical protein HOO96_30415 [Polyangiaceae bacterium]|nr:hypothetical protein [Polyangiaceae bacterium]
MRSLPRGLACLTLTTALVSGCREPKSSAEAPSPAAASQSVQIAPRSTLDAGPVLVDLLHSIACTVAVSSKVDNPKDFPEHLVDGKAETAWNSKTGDLHGFIAFRVPAVARVRRVELTAGFDKVGPSGDLFTKNHRITKVRLTREGKPVKEADLDPSLRGLQGFDVDEAGGDFKLEVLTTLPGTEKKWQELSVSELRVLGDTGGAPENPEHIPAMAIGSLDGVPAHASVKGEAPVGPFATLAALCAAYDKAMTSFIDAAFPGDRYPGKIEGPHCAPWQYPPAAAVSAMVTGGPFLSGQFVRVHDAQDDSAQLVLQTKEGYSLTKVRLWSRYHNDPGCGHASDHSLEDARLVKVGAHEALVLRLLRTDIYWLGATDPGGTFEDAYACKVDDHGAAACEGPVVSGRSVGWPGGWNPGAGTFPAIVASKVKWDSRKTPTLGPAGDLRLVP